MRCLFQHVSLFIVMVSLPVFAAGARHSAPKAKSTPEVPPAELLQKVVNNELAADKNDQSLWMYESRTRSSGAQTTKEAIETKHGNVSMTLLRNDKPLGEQEEKREDERIEKIAADPGGQRKLNHDSAEDGKHAERLLAALPKALELSYGERRGDLVQIDFKPNPKFHPSTHEGQVLRAMAGTIWVDTKEDRLAEIDGHLIQRVEFWGGLLGHLDRGGKFQVKQSEVGPGHWEIARMFVDMRGKALFFKTISEQQNEVRTDFQPVPQTITMAQAARKLEEQARQERASLADASSDSGRK